MASPTVGLVGTGVKGVGTLQPTPPTLTIGLTPDIMYAIHFNNNQAVTLTTANGFTEAPLSPQFIGTTGGSPSVRLSVFAKRAATTGDAGPIFSASSSGAGALIFTVKGVSATAALFHVTNGNNSGGAQGTVTIPGSETTLDECFVVNLMADHLDSGINRVAPPWSSTGLTSLTDWGFYRANAVGNGCGVAFCYGTKATKGAYGPTTVPIVAGSNLQQARFTFAVATGASATVPDSDFCCSGWCAAPLGQTPAPDHRHWHAEGGTPWVPTAVGAAPLARGWQAIPQNDVSWRARNVAATGGVMRFYLYFQQLPLNDTEIVRFLAASAGLSPELRYIASSQSLVAGIGGTVGTAAPIVAGKRYRIDVTADVSTGTRSIEWRLDGSDKGVTTRAVAANTLVQEVIGAGIDTPTIANATFSAIRMGTKIAAYPYNIGHSVAVYLTGDGTHSYNAAGDFKYEDGSNVPTAVTDSYARLIGLLTDANTRISRSGALVTEYLEWLFGGMPSTTAVNAVEIVTMHRGEDAAANAQTIRLVSGASTRDLTVAYSFPGPGPYVHSVHLTLDPTSVALTTSLINAWKLRGLLSATGLPAISGVIVEVDCNLTSPPSDPGGSTETNPSHTYAGAGTYLVTRTVTDNDGLTGSIAIPVTVA